MIAIALTALAMFGLGSGLAEVAPLVTVVSSCPSCRGGWNKPNCGRDGPVIWFLISAS